ncbi:MAG: Smr/MutS family protein [Paracoccaceae bacterium]
MARTATPMRATPPETAPAAIAPSSETLVTNEADDAPLATETRRELPTTVTLRRGAAHGGGASVSPAPDAFARAARLYQGAALPRPVGRPEAGLDRRTAERLRRGEREPDARLDLHGMTAERAHRALDRFLAQAVAGGGRVLLVITGKGGRAHPEDAPWLPPGRGVLRDAAPRWLRSGPHRGRILGIFEAHIRHGGAGAFYVYLRKSRCRALCPHGHADTLTDPAKAPR